MKVSKPTFKIVDIGPADQYMVWGEGVAEKRKTYGLKTICSRCQKQIDGEFIVAMKRGHPNYPFHVKCFDDAKISKKIGHVGE